MYITVTFNPSIDYIVFVNDFRAGNLNRAKAEHAVPGGKGLNVSMVLRNLGKQTKAFAFTGGILGDALTEMVKKEGIDFVSIPASSGETRINVKLKSGEETEINGKGPSIGKEELERLIIPAWGRTSRRRHTDTLRKRSLNPSEDSLPGSGRHGT